MEKVLYPPHPLRAIITGLSCSGKSVFLTNLILYIINEYYKIYFYSPSRHQDIYQKIIKCFSNYIPIHKIPNILNEEDIDVVIEELINNKDFQKSDTEIETFGNIEELRFPQGYEDGGKIILDDLNEKEMNDPRVKAMFKRSKHNILSIFLISKYYYKLLKRTIRANGNVYHIFKPNNFRDVQNPYQGKTSMDMTLSEYKNLLVWIHYLLE